ncbi:MAG: response regulator transcription factor [Saccharospirillum sp.]|uniref:response regulator transcription factor n=1 Tax=Saccharospirillum sp. TaxID=2033801 RepID=UPI003298E95D
MDIRVFISHSYPLLRYGLRCLITDAPGLLLVGENDAGRQPLRQLQRLKPDIALIEQQDNEKCWQTLDAIKVRGLAIRVILVAIHPRGEVIYRAMTVGAAGYITRQTPLDRIVEAIEIAAAGDVALSPDAQSSLQAFMQYQSHHHQEQQAHQLPRFSDVELEVLYLIAQGLSNSETGRLLHISSSTVKNHRQNLFAKLGVPNAPAAVYRAIQNGLLEP